MNDLPNLTPDVLWNLFLGFCAGLIAIKPVCVAWDYLIVGKFGLETKQQRQRREDHELLIKTSQNLAALQEKHEKDDHELKDYLSSFIEETRKENNDLRAEMRQIAENRAGDREVSREIRKELADSIKVIADGQTTRDKQIEALMQGSKELLGSTIDQLYSKYVELDGVPETEIDEFDDIFHAYKALNGNHRRDTKYDYVKHHLKVIPVETKLVK